MVRRDTRTDIIDAAVRILGRDGEAGFSAAALAAEVGISKAAVFHHFPTLDEIPLAAFERLVALILAAHPVGGASLERTLTTIGRGTFDLVEERRDFFAAYFVFLGRAMVDPRLKQRFRLCADELLGRMEVLLAPHVSSPREAGVLARLVAMMLDGMALHCLALGDRRAIEEAWTLFCNLLSKGQRAS